MKGGEKKRVKMPNTDGGSVTIWAGWDTGHKKTMFFSKGLGEGVRKGEWFIKEKKVLGKTGSKVGRARGGHGGFRTRESLKGGAGGGPQVEVTIVISGKKKRGRLKGKGKKKIGPHNGRRPMGGKKTGPPSSRGTPKIKAITSRGIDFRVNMKRR